MDLSPYFKCFYRFPVKSLKGERLETAAIYKGIGLKGDRRFAIAPTSLGAGETDTPIWYHKRDLHVLMRREVLAKFDCHFDDEAAVLTLGFAGDAIAEAVTEPEGKIALQDFIAKHSGLGPVDLLDYGTKAVKDAEVDELSILNLASVRALQEKMGTEIDPLRFRANVLIDGLEPFAEFDLVGREVTLHGAQIKVLHATTRCAATGVNPTTAERDLNIVKALKTHFGHVTMSVSCSVMTNSA